MKLTEERKAEVLALCKKLVSNRSYSGEENAVADVLKCFMRQKQFDDFCTDKYGNVIGKIKGDRTGNKVLFDGHMDTVPADNKEAWKHDLFVPVVEDGKCLHIEQVLFCKICDGNRAESVCTADNVKLGVCQVFRIIFPAF